MSVRRQNIVNRSACIGIGLLLSFALPGCDNVTSAEIAVESPVRIDPACVDAAAPLLGPAERFDRLPERPGERRSRARITATAIGCSRCRRPVVRHSSAYREDHDTLQDSSLQELGHAHLRRLELTRRRIFTSPSRSRTRLVVVTCPLMHRDLTVRLQSQASTHHRSRACGYRARGTA